MAGTNPNIVLSMLRRPATDPWQTFDNVQNQNLARQLHAAQLDNVRTEGATNKLKLTEAQRQVNDAAAMRTASAAGVQPGQTTSMNNGALAIPGTDVPMQTGNFAVKGPATFDRNAALDELAKTAPHLVPEAQQHFLAQDATNQKVQMELQKTHADFSKTQLENAGKTYELIGQLASPIAQLEAGGNATPEQLQSAYTNALIRAQQQGVDISNMPRQYQPGSAQSYVIAGMKAHEYVTSQMTAAQNAETAQHNRATEQNAAGTLTEHTRHNKAEEARQNAALDMQRDSMGNVRPETLDMLAKQYATTGNMPPLGMGKQAAALRQRILDRTSEMFPGVVPATSAAVYGANKHSLQQIQGSLDAIGAYENTARKNIGVFLNAAKNVIDSGSSWINTPLRKIAGGLGSTDQQAFDTARQTVLPEIARILNNPQLTGVLSDSARTEISNLLGPNASYRQIVRAVQVLDQDMTNRKTSLEDQLKTIGDRLGNNTLVTTPYAAPAPTPSQKNDPAGIL